MQVKKISILTKEALFSAKKLNVEAIALIQRQLKIVNVLLRQVLFF